MEADLSRYHHLDLRDRHRIDEHGRRALTLTMIRARVMHLPADSACAELARPPGDLGWQLEHVLLAQLWQAITGQPHPMLVAALERPRRPDPRRTRKIAAARQRAEARRRAIAAGEIT